MSAGKRDAGDLAGRSGEGDGRNIDPALGSLLGEAAQQRGAPPARAAGAGPVKAARAVGAAAMEAARAAGADAGAGAGPSYYGLPMLKEHVWKWPVPLYFFVGGLAGVSATLAAAARPAGLRGIARAGRLIAFGGAVVSGGLLIRDLGRPERFLYMLRVFRPSSPMNVGTWLLSAFGAMASGAMLLPEPLASAAGVVAGVLGLPLAGYTGVLLANTAVPVWQGGRTALPVLFLASATASAGSVLELLALDEREQRVARRVALLGKAAELAAGMALEREVARVESVGRPLVRSPLWKAAKVFTAAGLAISALPRKPLWLRAVGGVLGTLGSLATRFAVVQAGKASARNPRAAFEQQRAEARGVQG